MKTILLVDDNNYIIEALALTLTRYTTYGNILKAQNGREGVDIMNSTPVDLVLTDLDMPVMDGYGLVEYRNRHFPHVPIVVMTGDASPDVLQRLNALGIAECLEKPFDYDIASCLVRKLLANPHCNAGPQVEALHPVSV